MNEHELRRQFLRIARDNRASIDEICSDSSWDDLSQVDQAAILIMQLDGRSDITSGWKSYCWLPSVSFSKAYSMIQD